MKEIRQITTAVATGISDENNNDNKINFIKDLGSESMYFQQVIRPMLVPGHETELVYWLKNFGLIRDIQYCKNINAVDNTSCNNKAMFWTPTTKGQDLYQWRCSICLGRKSIRDESVFVDVKCSLKNAVRILLGWCKGLDIEEMARILELKKLAISTLYNSCAIVAERHIRANINEWQVGGPGKIVLIQIYPEGFSNSLYHNTSRPTLCILEAMTHPQKCWFESFNKCNRNAPQLRIAKAKLLSIIREVVVPGSLLVLPLTSTYCSYYDVQCLSEFYPVIVSLDGIARHNNLDNNLQNNLQVIWNGAQEVCEESQFYGYQYVQQHLIGQMWRYRFGQDAFETLLYQISLMQ